MVNWECMLETMESMGFGPKWLGWIRGWLHLAKTQITLNGEGGKEIKCRRGLRHGDSLSPLLFTLVSNGLNKLLNKANKGIECLKKDKNHKSPVCG